MKRPQRLFPVRRPEASVLKKESLSVGPSDIVIAECHHPESPVCVSCVPLSRSLSASASPKRGCSSQSSAKQHLAPLPSPHTERTRSECWKSLLLTLKDVPDELCVHFADLVDSLSDETLGNLNRQQPCNTPFGFC